MKTKLFVRIIWLIAAVCGWEMGWGDQRAAALEIKFSGIITEVMPGSYGVAVGDVFSGILFYEPAAPPGQGDFGGAIVNLLTSRPLPPLVFHPQNSSLTVGDNFFFVVGNPYDFFGFISLWMDDRGQLAGGEFFANSEPKRNAGNFHGIISVPDAAATITLLGLGLAALSIYRRHARN